MYAGIVVSPTQPNGDVIVRLTSYEPGMPYVTVPGLQVLSITPLPKFQLQLALVPGAVALVKSTFIG